MKGLFLFAGGLALLFRKPVIAGFCLVLEAVLFSH